MQKLTAASLAALQAPAKGVREVRDDRVRGLSLRMFPSGRSTWSFRYRPRSASSHRRITVGEYPAIGLAEARQAATKFRGEVSTGADPQAERNVEREAITLEALIDRYMTDEVEPKRKYGTRLLYRGYFRNHIPSFLKRHKAAQITRSDIAKLHRELGVVHPASANRLIVAISGLFTWGFRNGYLSTEVNPARMIQKFREQGRERYLSGEELGRLGETLRIAETDGLPWPDMARASKHERKEENRKTVLSAHAVAALRLLLFTGCRLREILHLRWSEVDLESGLLRLSDSKTGRKPVVLNAPALEVLALLPRFGQYVVAGNSVNKPRADLKRVWDTVRLHAGLDDVRLHDLRHTHASTGVNAGLSLPLIGGLLGHKHTSTTARYAHLRNDPLREASARIGAELKARLTGTASIAEVTKIRA